VSRVDVDRVRAQIDLVELVGREVKLRRNGKTWRGRCPIHGGDRDSLRVKAVRWECFACGERGDVVDWVMKVQGLSFRAAVEYLLPGLGNPSVDPAEEPATWDAVEAKLQRERPEYFRRVDALAQDELEWAAFEGRPLSWREAEDRAERWLLAKSEAAPRKIQRSRLAVLIEHRLIARWALAQLAQHG
jgi:hypothetical protein